MLKLAAAQLVLAHGAPSTFCNPVNVDYRFSMLEPSHREAADPTMVVHNDTYWLFASKSGGYWYSEDMSEWTLVTPTGLPLEDYAPMVVVLDGKFYYTAFDSRAIFTTDNPKLGKWTKVADLQPYADPGMLVDDDGRVFMYHGSGQNGSLHAVELNSSTWQEIGDPVVAVVPDYKKRGFEVGGDNNENLTFAPFVEGAFMNKIDGRYFLQYAVPGTQFKSYADGLFVGDSPLGPFEFQPYSPMSSKPTGFAAGAGHGSSYQDYFGQLWHIATSTISIRHLFERRLGIHPLVKSGDRLWTDSYLGDYPQPLPGKSKETDGRGPAWMLLSLNKSAKASSGKSPSLAFDEDIRSWWSADADKPGEWLQVDLGGKFTVRSVQVNFADEGCTIVGERPLSNDTYKYFVEYCVADTDEACDWKIVDALNRSSNTRDMPHDYVELPAALTGVTHMRLTGLHMPGGARLSISGFRIFGEGPEGGSTPAKVSPQSVRVNRDPADKRQVTVSWPEASGAEFYIIRYGTKCDGCYSTIHSYNVYGATQADLHSLVVGYDYDFVVDAVNSNGITYGDADLMV